MGKQFNVTLPDQSGQQFRLRHDPKSQHAQNYGALIKKNQVTDNSHVVGSADGVAADAGQRADVAFAFAVLAEALPHAVWV